MKKPELHKTRNYDEFISHEFQQPMSAKHVNDLIGSMRDHGYLPSKPVQCYLDTQVKKFRIIDGHHRFNAAKALGIDFFYVVEPKSHADLIGRENVIVRKWTALSFVKYYAAKGNTHYLTLKKYVDKGIQLNVAAGLLRGETTGSGNSRGMIPEGTYKVKTTDSIDRICTIIDAVKESCPEVKKRVYIEALAACLLLREFDAGDFIKKAKLNPTMLQPASMREQALDMIEDVYNYRNQNKLALSFLASEMLKTRKKTFGRTE
jgi:hypothetical protein